MKSRRCLGLLKKSTILNVGILAAVLALLIQPAAQAYPGLNDNTGYFTGSAGTTDSSQHDSILPWTASSCSFAGLSGSYWGSVIAGDYNSQYMALPLNQSGGTGGNKAQFRDFLVNQYNANRCDGWTRTGVAFIVHTMLGHSPGRSATLSQADWDEFNSRIVNDSAIVMSYNPSANPVQNSYSRGFLSGGSKDAYFYQQAGGSAEPMYQFTSADGYRYNIKLRCANPAGEIVITAPTFPPVGQIDNATCTRVSGWAYDPDRPSASINVLLYIDGVFYREYTAGELRADVNGAYGITGNHGYDLALPATVINGSAHTISVIARGIAPNGVPDNKNMPLGTVAIGPCYDYALVPSATASDAVVAAGQPVSFSYNVNKTGTTGTPAIAVAIKHYVVQPGQTFNQLGGFQDNVNTNNCDARYGNVCATSYPQASRTFGPGLTSVAELGVPAVNTSNMTPGTRVCRMLALDPAAQNPAGLVIRQRWSAPACVTIGKKPYLTVMNGDVWAGGVFSDGGSCTVPTTQRPIHGSRSTFTDGATYGAFVEYGLLSLKNVEDFGSAGKPSGTALTFRNTPTPTGNFSSATEHCLNDALTHYGSLPPDLTISGSANIANFTSGRFLTAPTDNAPLTITGPANQLTISAGRHLVVIANGDIVIEKNIVFADGPYTNLADIPSLVLISRNGNIVVSQDVTRLDGFYQAKGDFITCREGGPNGGIGTNAGICSNQLTVNGAVTASRIVARRIAGGVGAERNLPAERIIMRPDLFMSLYGESQSGGQLRTVGENELPPRY